MKKVTKKQRVWNYIKEHGNISSLDAIYKCNYTRLSGYICIWRKNGIQIISKEERTKSGDSYARYYITKKEIKRAEKEQLVHGRSA